MKLTLIVLKANSLIRQTFSFSAFPDSVRKVDNDEDDLENNESLSLLSNYKKFSCLVSRTRNREINNRHYNPEKQVKHH